ncbi:SIR2 family NAD-dependent protein deacylase [Bacillus massiliglaciei]|uniref:SIR2 family NAD-dependent protein deacylase n=1 Tax=Bacillus massiliglaciei TaxID=1816693 RepID=UPI0018FE3967|nr:SIR2 family protein [Bacillus massiliglaciei]
MSMKMLLEQLKRDELVLWAGSGFSLYSGMPEVHAIKKALLQECSPEVQNEMKTITQLPDFCDKFIQMNSRDVLLHILSSMINKPPCSLKYHQLLTKIPQIRTIISTNYDLLFEKAYGDQILSLIGHDFIDQETKRVKLFKIHGDIRFPESIIITKSDYQTFLSKVYEPVWKELEKIVMKKSILFVGYSFSDLNIQFLLKKMNSKLGKVLKQSYLVSPQLPAQRIKVLQQKNIHFLQMKAEDLIQQLYRECGVK